MATKNGRSRARAAPITDITGRDGYLINKALAYAIEAIDRLPKERQAVSNRADMIDLLNAREDAYLAAFFRQLARAALNQKTEVGGQI